MILQKLYVLEKSLSQVIYENACGQLDCKIFEVLISQKLRYKVSFLNVVKFSWKSQFDHVIFFGSGQACPKRSEKSAIQILRKDFVNQCDFFVLNDTSTLRIYKNYMALKNLVLEL